MKMTILHTLSLLAILSACAQPASEEQLKAEWSKMNASKSEELQTFNEAKYGMFIHWGLYAIPGGIWKGKKMEEMRPPHVAEWIQHSAEISRAEYAALAGEFNPVDFDAGSIAALARDAGMKYLVITTKHHDGFAMYDSPCSKFDIIDATPYKKDVVRALYDACKRYGIDFGIYYSHNIDWADGGDCQYSVMKAMNDARGKDTRLFGPNLWDPSPNTFDEYLKSKAFPQVRELLTMFPEMKQLWYDMAHYITPQQSFDFYRLAYTLQPKMIVNERVGNGFGDFDIPGDNKIPTARQSDKPWQTVGTLNNSWGFKSYDHDWKSPKELLFWLVEIVSKGGNYMLNIGPEASGKVPEESAAHLLAVGEWLKINGKAIYGSTPWRITHEGPTKIEMKGTGERSKKGFKAHFTTEDFWFTAQADKIYAIALESGQHEVVIGSLAGEKITHVALLGSQARLPWKLTERGLELTLPDRMANPLGYVLEISIK